MPVIQTGRLLQRQMAGSDTALDCDSEDPRRIYRCDCSMSTASTTYRAFFLDCHDRNERSRVKNSRVVIPLTIASFIKSANLWLGWSSVYPLVMSHLIAPFDAYISYSLKPFGIWRRLVTWVADVAPNSIVSQSSSQMLSSAKTRGLQWRDGLATRWASSCDIATTYATVVCRRSSVTAKTLGAFCIGAIIPRDVACL